MNEATIWLILEHTYICDTNPRIVALEFSVGIIHGIHTKLNEAMSKSFNDLGDLFRTLSPAAIKKHVHWPCQASKIRVSLHEVDAQTAGNFEIISTSIWRNKVKT